MYFVNIFFILIKFADVINFTRLFVPQMPQIATTAKLKFKFNSRFFIYFAYVKCKK